MLLCWRGKFSGFPARLLMYKGFFLGWVDFVHHNDRDCLLKVSFNDLQKVFFKATCQLNLFERTTYLSEEITRLRFDLDLYPILSSPMAGSRASEIEN